jgi:hypothetical protein
MQDMYGLRHRGLVKKGHAQPPVGTPKGSMLMVALPALKDPPVGTLKGPLLMVELPTLKDPPVRTLMEKMLMLALPTHKESLMNISTDKWSLVVVLTPMMVQVALYWLKMNLQKVREGEVKEI